MKNNLIEYSISNWNMRALVILPSGVARILLQGGTGAWRTGSEVCGDKVIQKWKPSGVRSAKTNMDEVFLQQPATVTGDFDGLTSSWLNSAER